MKRVNIISALLLSGATLVAMPARAQVAAPVVKTTSEQLQDAKALVAALEKKQEAEAAQALVDEKAAIAKADAARAYYKSINKPVPGEPPVEADDPIKTATEAAATDGVKTTVTEKPDGTKETKIEPQKSLADDEDGKRKFGGVEFGIGFGFSSDTGDRDRVRTAEVVNGIVRVTQSDNQRARLLLETHYLLTPPGKFLFGIENEPDVRNEDTRKLESYGRKEWGFGPFFALQPGTDNVIDSIGAGLMFGVRRPGEGTGSFNIGVGFLYDIESKVLGDGIIENKPLPVGEPNVVRLQTRSQKGFLFMTSYSF